MTDNTLAPDFESLRSRLLDDIFLGLGIAAIPAVIISLSRIVMFGFQPFMLIQIVLVAALWAAWFKRKQIPYLWRATLLQLVLWIATFAALFQLGPASDSKVFMILFAFTSMLFYSARSAWLWVTGIIITMVCFAYAATQHWLQFSIDFQEYAHHPLPWVITVWNMGIFSSIVAYIGWRMIHGLRQQSEATHELANRLQKITERVPGVVFQYKFYPDGHSSFPYVSEAFKDVFNINPNTVRKNADALLSLIHDKDKPVVLEGILTSAKTLTPWQQDFRIVGTDNRICWLSVNAVPQQEEDEGILWHGVMTDITERKNAEHIKKEFVSTVSHELRTPLTSIRGSIRLLNSGVLDTNKDEQKKMLNIAEQNTQRLLFLINDLLDIEKLENNSIVLHPTWIKIKEVIEVCISENQSFANEYNTSINITHCDDIELYADEDRLKQIITNLLSNACKYSPPDKPVEVSVRQQNQEVILSVTDYGPGIPNAFKSLIFEKFTQADSSSTRKIGGTGLGLAIVKQLVELHDGYVDFETQEGEGTTFNVHLPMK